MLRRPAFRWLLLLGAVCALAGGVLAWRMKSAPSFDQRLEDGRVFAIAAVTFGTNHVLEQGVPWARLMARHGSQSLAYRLGYSSSRSQPGTNSSVVVWTAWPGTDTNPPPRFAAVMDGHGMQTEPRYIEVDVSRPKSGDRLVAWKFENYPRREKNFIVRFYDYDLFRIRARKIGEVVVDNPARVTMPAAAPSVTLSAATNGPLECALLSLECGGPPPRLPLTSRQILAPWNAAVFSFNEGGEPATNWTVRGLEAFGATENYFSVSEVFVEKAGGRCDVRFAAPFWREEPDWKLSVEVARTAGFAQDTLWSLRLDGTNFSDNGLTLSIPSAPPVFGGLNVRVHPANSVWPGNASRDLRLFRLIFTGANIPPDLAVGVVQVTDADGRHLPYAVRPFPVSRQHSADIGVPRNVKNLNLLLALDYTRRFEFRVRPTQLGKSPGGQGK